MGPFVPSSFPLRILCYSKLTGDRSAQPTQLRLALEGLEGLAFEYAVVREVLKGQKGWRGMHNFVASSKYCRAHEAEALNGIARKVLVCVEEAAVHETAAQIASTWASGEALIPFLRCGWLMKMRYR